MLLPHLASLAQGLCSAPSFLWLFCPIPLLHLPHTGGQAILRSLPLSAEEKDQRQHPLPSVSLNRSLAYHQPHAGVGGGVKPGQLCHLQGTGKVFLHLELPVPVEEDPALHPIPPQLAVLGPGGGRAMLQTSLH